MAEAKVTFTLSTGETIIGLKATPSSTPSKSPAIILVHGFAYRKEEDGVFDEFAQRFSSMGFIVYRFDFAGCGESEGDYRYTTPSFLVKQLQEIVNLVRKDPQVDPQRLSMMTWSFGSTIALALQEKLEFLIFGSVLGDPYKCLSGLFGSGFNPQGLSRRDHASGRVTYMESPFWDDLESYEVRELITKVNCPLLFIHGSADPYASLEDMKNLFAVANQPKKQLVFEGADHGMKPFRKEMYDWVCEWVEKLTIHHRSNNN